MDARPTSFGNNAQVLAFAARLPGEMARLVLEKDWSTTPLGPVEDWPAALKAVAEIVLASRFPTAVRWGPQLVSIYNDAYATLLGPKHPAALGAPIDQVWPEILDELGPLNRAILHGERPAFFEKMHLWRVQRHGIPEDARFTASYSPIPDSGAPNGIGGILVATLDTTQEFRADQQLRRLTERLEDEVWQRTRERDRVWQISEDLMAVTDFQGAIHSANPAWQQMLGWSEDELKRMTVEDLRHPDDAPAAKVQRQRLQAGAPQARMENRFRDKNGEWHWFNWTLATEGKLIYVIGRNITAAKKAEQQNRETERALAQAREQLAQAQKMDALGQLTGGIAHDFNNMLMVVGGYTQFLKQRLQEPKDKRAIEAIEFAASRAESLTRQLLTFSRRQSLNRTTVKLAECFETMRDILETTAKGNVVLSIAVPDDTWQVSIDVNEFEVAIINLVVNARDAMPNGGRINISACNEMINERNAIDLLRGEFVAIEIEDEGDGIPPEIVPKVFDPFFTTKSLEKGTGLGLSQVYGFAHQAGGTVRLTSKVNVGTRVTLYLPRSKNAAMPVQDNQGAGPPGGNETILLVEDHPDVQAIAADMLEGLGYAVHTAGSAGQALDTLQNGLKIDLVLTDIVMPGPMDGLGLAQHISREHPDVKILLTTGYSQATSDARTPFAVLRKPYQLATMARAVRNAIDQPKRPH